MKKVKRFNNYNKLKDFMDNVGIEIPSFVSEQWELIKTPVKFTLTIYSEFRSETSGEIELTGLCLFNVPKFMYLSIGWESEIKLRELGMIGE